MNSAKQDEFEDLLAFNLSETRRINLSSQAKISTVEGFVSSYNWGRIHRIYGWISDVSLKKNRRHKTMLHFSFIDGSGELINLSTCSLDLSDCYDVESFLFEFSCLDILMSEDGELEIANLSLLKKNTEK